MFYIILEYLKNGEVFDYLSKTGPFSENLARFYFMQLMEGLTLIHNAGICHRDIKLENLLYDKDFNLRISDFGLAGIPSLKKATTLYHK